MGGKKNPTKQNWKCVGRRLCVRFWRKGEYLFMKRVGPSLPIISHFRVWLKRFIPRLSASILINSTEIKRASEGDSSIMCIRIILFSKKHRASADWLCAASLSSAAMQWKTDTERQTNKRIYSLPFPSYSENEQVHSVLHFRYHLFFRPEVKFNLMETELKLRGGKKNNISCD